MLSRTERCNSAEKSCLGGPDRLVRGLASSAASLTMSGPVAVASYCPLHLPTPMFDDRSAHLWPTNSGWAPPALQIPDTAFTDRSYQRVGLIARGNIDLMKSQISIALGRKDAVNKQRMKMQLQIQCRAKALDQCHRTRMSLRYLEACLVDQVGQRRYIQIARLTMDNTLPIIFG
jgi:hypothetical protein